VGVLLVEVSHPGASILIDRHQVGTSPVSYDVFAEPGVRTIEAQLDGFTTASTAIEVKPGTSQRIALRLEPRRTPKEAGGRGVGRAVAPREAESDAQGRPWGRWPLGLAAGLAATELAAGIGFTVAANAKSERAAQLLEDRNAEPRDNNRYVCSPNAGGTCAEIWRELGKRDTFQALAITAYVASGVSAAAAIALLILPHNRSAVVSGATIAPLAEPRVAGAIVRGSF
jgi:hypothetical protein